MVSGSAGVVWLGMALAVAPQGEGDDTAGARGREELVALVRRIQEPQKEPETGELLERERLLGLDFSIVEGAGIRVLVAGGGAEEARRAWASTASVRALFVELTGLDASYPAGLSAYLLASPEAKAAFLGKHPSIGKDAGARFAKLDGSGIPGTADWAWWEGDAEKRLDGLVRIALDWLCRSQGVTLERHAWLHEGLGFYLTHALLGTRLAWFVQPHRGGGKREATNVALRVRMDEPGADWMSLSRGLFAAQQGFDLEELLHLEARELEALDHLRAHALAGYLVEVRRSALGTVLTRLGQGEDPRAVLEEAVGCSLTELRERLHGWLERREALLAEVEGRRTAPALEAQWRALDARGRRAASAAFRRGLADLDTQQMRWLRAVLAEAPVSVPPAGELPFFDPKLHAPAQPIPRKRLPPSSERVKRLLAEVRRAAPPEALELTYDYDRVRGSVVRTGDPDEPEVVFRNALRGAPPGADLARALLLARLERADERKLQAALGHAYTDREGNVYPVTLYEMLGSGIEIERPDVDALGIVHEVLDEWRRWTAPVPGTQHAPLYELINGLSAAAKSSRELQENLAELYLLPSAAPSPGFESLGLNLQALWASHDSKPAKLAALLPDGKGRDAFLAALVERCKKDYPLYAQGRRRAAQLRRDGEALRALLGAALDEAVEAAAEDGGRGSGSDGKPPAGGR
jgi:hypothetical protein